MVDDKDLKSRVRAYFAVQPYGTVAHVDDLLVDVRADLPKLVSNDEAQAAVEELRKANKEVPKDRGEALERGRVETLAKALDELVKAGDLKRVKDDQRGGLGFRFDGAREPDQPEGQRGKVQRLPIDQIRVDTRLQMRAKEAPDDVVTRYAASADQLPPGRVFRYKNDAGEDVYLLSRGFTRMRAWKLAGFDRVPVEVFEGDREAAALDAAGDNAAHGRPRTADDVERAVSEVLSRYPKASVTWVASVVKVAWATADKIVRRLRPDKPDRVTDARGREQRSAKSRGKGNTDRSSQAPSPNAPDRESSGPKVLSGIKAPSGQDVPADVVGAFTDARAIQAIKGIRENLEFLRDLQGDGYAVFSLSVPERAAVIREMEEKLDTLRLALPYAVCPEKPGEKFKAAARRKWMTEAEWVAWRKSPEGRAAQKAAESEAKAQGEAPKSDA